MNLKISRILHAGYVFECNGFQIAFDPIFENPFSQNCYAFPNVRFDHEKIKKLQFSAVFISHFHDDHCSLESLNFLDRKTPIYIYCVFEELFMWIKELGVINVYSVEINVPIKIADFEITPHQALDSDVDSIFQIKAAGLNILNVVDSWIDDLTLAYFQKISPWDMVLWPFQTMREIEVIAPSRSKRATSELPTEWIDQLKILNPRYVIPSSCQFIQESWSWYKQAYFPISYLQFQQQVEAALPGSKVFRLNPSVAVTLNKHSIQVSSSLSWVHPVGDQNIDYEYNGDLKPPSTSEISQKFAPLTFEQTEEVYKYCRVDIFKAYQSIAPPVDIYFKNPRWWRLSVYDHNGEAKNFHYYLKNGNLEMTDLKNEESLSWFTEVPISKFYAALTFGESLTSMYLRINDMIFESQIEAEIETVDIFEDPLIRCLFSGVFGAYQKAQLQKIMK